ncbi:hypothetical protein AB4Z52_12665 [Rhizobium sp. 2YAF20]|uniref:hypothetical protein n=1 Tax=Rhizobium sp. 2YAF20 TaxID=3233027 RepID=UPI003F9EB913
MTKTATTRAKRNRHKRKPLEKPVYYTVVESWEWSYSFGVNHMTDNSDVYSDYRHLHLIGKLLRPSQTKADAVRLIFLPDNAYNRDQWHRHHRPHIGTLNLHRGQLDGLFSLPGDVLPSLLTMLTGDRIRFAVLRGAKLRYGHAEVHDFRLEMDLDEDDLPPETT